MSELTRLLNNAAGGDTVSLNQLYDLVFAELRAMAAHKMASERRGHTLQPTALVNEALDDLAREDPIKAEVVKLRYFVGLKHQEIADALGVSEPTIRRHWAVARVRLFELVGLRSVSPETLDKP